MKKLLTLLFIVDSIISVAQNSFDRWVPTSGTNTYTTNITGFPSSYNNTQAYIKFGNANNAASTLAINSMSAISIRLWDGDSWQPATAGQIPANSNAILAYDNINGYYKAVIFENIGGGGSVLANNGASFSGDTLQLGGNPLIKNTLIDLNGKNLVIENNNAIAPDVALSFLPTRLESYVSDQSYTHQSVFNINNFGYNPNTVQLGTSGGNIEFRTGLNNLDPLLGTSQRLLFDSAGNTAFNNNTSFTINGDTIINQNTGDQTSIIGITGTKAEFNTAATDGDFLWVGDITQYTDELAQDAVGGMVDGTLIYTDITPLLSRAALTGDISASAGSNSTTLATVNSNVGTFGSATQVAQQTVNAKGLTTAISNVTITPSIGSITGLGTGVSTALGINIGTSGSFITNGGALGTPSSGVATNLTGTASGLTSGTVTTNANLTGDVTSSGNATTYNSTVPVTKGGTGTTTQFTLGSVVFAGSSGVYSQDNSNYFWDDSSNRLGIGTTSPSAKIDVSGDDADNSIVSTSIKLRHTTSGTPATGIGTGLDFETETSANNNEVGVSIQAFTTDATAASEDFDLVIKNMAAGAAASETVRIKSTGNLVVGTANNIQGTATNNSAAAGNIGERTTSSISTYTNFTTTATYQNITSISLTAGDWDISAFYSYYSNSATITAASDAIFVISTTTASASGATEGKNIAYIPQATLLGTSHESGSIAPYQVSLSGTTTYYLNAQATFTLGNPQYVGTIRAVRVR